MSNPSRHLASSLPGPNVLKGFLLLASGLFLFACMDAATKYLTTLYNVPTVVAMRYLVHFSLMLIILAPRHSTSLIKTQRTGMSIFRAFSLVFASLFMALALQRMPMPEATAINFLSPILIAIVAGAFMQERIGVVGWLTAIGGFIGVLMIARPGSGLDTLGVIFAFGAAVSNAIYQVLSRTLASTEKAVTLLFYTALVGSLFYGLLLPFYWEGRIPSWFEVGIFASMGTLAGLGHYLFTLAYRYASTSVLGPMLYLQLVWASLLGFIIFGTLPDLWGICGMIIIVVSGLAIAFKAHTRRD